MTLETGQTWIGGPLTATLRLIFSEACERGAADDLLFLERWEICPLPGSASALRVSQIRRANPELATAIRRELGSWRQQPA
jgi:hypothetical protein